MPRGNDLLLGNGPGNKSIGLDRQLRDRHLYICGASRTGKSKFLEHLIRQDIKNHYKSGCGLLLLDWHGSLYDNLIKWITSFDVDRDLPVLPIDLRRDDFVISYNLLKKREGAYASVVTAELIKDLAYAWGQSGTNQTPRFRRIADDVLRPLYEHNLTLAEGAILMDRNPTPLRIALAEKVSAAEVRDDWRLYNRMRPEKFEDYFESTIGRLRRFISNPLMHAMFGQDGRSFDWRRALDQGWIVFVSLAKGKGKISEEDCATLATLMLSNLWQAAQARDKAEKPRPFHLYLDEFQHFITPTLAENLDEAGGFGLHVTMAQQFPTQLLDQGSAGQRVYNSVMANAATKVVFRTAHQADLLPLAKELFMGVIDLDEIKHVIESTKVLDYEEDSRTVTTTTEGESEGESSPKFDGDDPSASDNGSVSAGHSRVETTTEQYFLRPVLGKEVSSVQYRSVEEQLHRAMTKINTLRARHCIARLAETHQPIAFRTNDVNPGCVTKRDTDRYTTKRLQRWKFVLPLNVAEENIRRRREELEKRFLHDDDPGDDPINYRCPVG